MANFEFKLPDIGEGVAEGEIVGWLVKQGDWVNEGQDMVEIMTDKATVTIGAPKTGRVAQVNGAVGDTLPVGSVLVIIDLDGPAPDSRGESTPKPAAAPAPAAPAAAKPKAAADDGPVASAVGDIRTSLPGLNLGTAAGPQSGQVSFNDRPLAAPATRKLARELGVDLKHVEATGKSGRILRDNVERVSARGAAPSAAPPSSAAPAIKHVTGEDERIPVRGLRKRIFDNMARSKHTAAHFTFVDECDVTTLQELRERLAPRAKESGVKLTYLPFIVKAVAMALKKYPALNALIDDAAQEIIMRKRHDIGVAMATDAGLIVPVLRDVDRLSLLDIAQEISRLAEAARAGKTAAADLGGSSFTITSARQIGRIGGYPGHQLPRSGHPVRSRNEEAPGRARRSNRHRPGHAPEPLLRPPRHRWRRRREVRQRDHCTAGRAGSVDSRRLS